MILNRRAGTASRPAFTMIELLTVIAIIVLILGIGIGAFFRVRVSQEEKATETSIAKIQNQFNAAWRTVVDNAKDDAKQAKIPASVKAMAGNDNRRATVIWTKVLLKLEFPTCFYDAVVWPTTVGLSPKPSYRIALQSLSVASFINPATATAAQRDQLMAESAVMLYASLAQSRRGVTAFNPVEHVGPHAVGTVNLYGLDFPIFVDTWGQPIGFIRWPSNGAASDLNQPPQQVTNNQGLVIDPQDPERTLLDNDWFTSAGKTQFENLPLHAITNPPLNLTPVICSAGRDKSWGIDIFFGPDGTGNDADNIYGYRLTGVGRNN